MSTVAPEPLNVLEFKGVSIADGGPAVLTGVDLRLDAGERLVVFGSSGSGKRALLKTAAGVLRPAAGVARLAGRGPCPVGYVTREGGLLNNETLLRNVMLPVLFHRALPREEASRRALRLLAEFGIERLASLRPASAPVSARRLAQFARALLCEPVLYVLESPLDEMDAAGAHGVRAAMERIKKDGKAAALLGTGSPGPYLQWGGRFQMIQGSHVRVFDDRAALLADPDPDVKLHLS